MSTELTREIDCLLCHTPYLPIIQSDDEEDGYPIVCSSAKCANGVFMSNRDPVRTAFRAVFGIRGEPLALALEEALAECPCGDRFRHDAGKRCPECIRKIQSEKRDIPSGETGHHFLWNTEALKKHEQKFIGFVLDKSEDQETLNELVERFELAEISTEEYLERLDLLQNRDGVLLSILKTWAMALGPFVFRAADDLDLVEQFGTRVLVTLASGLNVSTGQSVLALLTKEAANLDGNVEKELRTYLGKITGQ